jgi:hypothetical protein
MVNDVRKQLLALVEIKRDGIKTQNMKRTRMITKYRIEKGKFVSSDCRV